MVSIDETEIAKTLITISERTAKIETTLDHVSRTLDQNNDANRQLELRVRIVEEDIASMKTSDNNHREFNGLLISLALIFFTAVANAFFTAVFQILA